MNTPTTKKPTPKPSWGAGPNCAESTGSAPSPREFRNEYLSTFWDAMERDDAEEAAKREGWRSPQGYTGDNCEHCGRNRVLICNNGKHVCEKCNWDQHAHEYSDRPSC